MGTHTDYRTVFDISQKGFDWWFPLAGVAFVFVGLGLVWWGRRNRWSLYKNLTGYFMVIFALFWSIGTFTATHSEYSNLQREYQEGYFSVVEGLVHDFHPMPYEGHQDECFSVLDQTFCYSDFSITAGFNNSRSHGGPIKEGLPVRVSYIGNTIVRLDVKGDALASAEGRASIAEAAKIQWQQHIDHDPVINHMNLGFGIAAVFMTAWWNLQSRRFMRFWIKPPYKPLITLLFRTFFAANLISAVWYLIEQAIKKDLSRSDYLIGIEVGATMIGVIWILVRAVEWINRKQISSS